MKQFLIIILSLVYFLLNVSIAKAQEETPPPPAVKSPIPLAPGLDDRLIIDITLDNFAESPASMEVNTFKSRGINVKLMKDKLINNSSFSIGYGLAFGSQNFDTDRLIITDDTAGRTHFVAVDPNVDVKKNKLSVNYLDIPLELRYRSKTIKKDNKFKISAGFKIGILLQSHIKYDDNDGKVKYYRIKNLNKYRYGVEGRIGYGIWGLNAYYSLLPLFDENKAPELVPVSFGLSITPF